MPRYTLCPFYIDENNKTISCEDVCRSYDSHDEKWAWMDMYCDSWDWMRCPYAADLSEAYKRAEEGDSKALDEQKEKAMKSEIKSLTTKLGRLSKKVERQEKKIEDLKAVNKSFIRKNEELYIKWRKTDEQLRQQNDKIWGEIGSLSGIYEQRMCYLIETFAGGRFYEEDAEAWAGDKAFALVHDKDKDDGRRYWKVVYGPEETEEDGHEDTDIQTEE